MTISPSQAAKLRELTGIALNAVWANQHSRSRDQMEKAEADLDAYITSLTASAQSGESK